jgi:hypothetical protein
MGGKKFHTAEEMYSYVINPILLSQDRRVFRTSDLAVLWQITSKNTLLTTIRRYCCQASAVQDQERGIFHDQADRFASV